MSADESCSQTSDERRDRLPVRETAQPVCAHGARVRRGWSAACWRW